MSVTVNSKYTNDTWSFSSDSSLFSDQSGQAVIRLAPGTTSTVKFVRDDSESWDFTRVKLRYKKGASGSWTGTTIWGTSHSNTTVWSNSQGLHVEVEHFHSSLLQIKSPADSQQSWYVSVQLQNSLESSGSFSPDPQIDDERDQ